jgi:hypothetical protein
MWYETPFIPRRKCLYSELIRSLSSAEHFLVWLIQVKRNNREICFLLEKEPLFQMKRLLGKVFWNRNSWDKKLFICLFLFLFKTSKYFIEIVIKILIIKIVYNI